MRRSGFSLQLRKKLFAWRVSDDIFPAIASPLHTTIQMLFAALDRDAAPDGNPLSNNFSSQGGTLPGQVFMHLAGDGWLEPLDVRGDYAGEFLAWFFAHEAAHLYQRASDYNSIEEDAWIHEGSAEAFAAITMQELELASDASIETRKTQSVEKCLEGLKQDDLRTAGSRQDFDLYYS